MQPIETPSPVTTPAPYGIVDAKSVRPILDFITAGTKRTQAKYHDVAVSVNGCARLAWTNGEANLVADLPCEHQGPDFTVLVPANRLVDTLKAGKGKTLQIDFDSVAVCGPSRVGLVSDPQSATVERPASLRSPAKNVSATATLTSSELRRCLLTAIPHTDSESCRYALGGVFIHSIAGGLAFCGTDSRRLLVAQCAASLQPGDDPIIPHVRENGPSPAPKGKRKKSKKSPASSEPAELVPFEGVFPAKYAKSLCNILPQDDSPVTLELTKFTMAVFVGELQFRTKLIEGRFPNYLAGIVPELGESGSIAVDADPTEFRTAIDGLAAEVKSAEKEFRSIVSKNCHQESPRGVKFNFGKNSCGFTADRLYFVGMEKGVQQFIRKQSFSGEFLINRDAGDQFTITLDPQFILDFLKTIPKGSPVSLQFNGQTPSESPVRIDAAGLVYVVMPLTPDR